MQEPTEFGLAERRFEDRERKRSLLIFWLALLAIVIVLHVVLGDLVCLWLPLELLAIVMAVKRGVELYYSTPRLSIRVDLIEQEMNWLFGVNWRDYVGVQHYVFAQDRIRKRRLERWISVLILLISIPLLVGGLIVVAKLGLGGQISTAICFAIPLIWIGYFVILRTWRLFFDENALAAQEQKIGVDARFELKRMYPEKLKNKEKPVQMVDDFPSEKGKRKLEESEDTVGDDGELVEFHPLDDEDRQTGQI